jgi:hypothetical protein
MDALTSCPNLETPLSMEVRMNERFYQTDVIPHLVPPGRVLAHNRVRHTNGFRCWTWLKDEVPPDFTPCECGWSGLPHLAPPSNNRRAQHD